MEAKHPGFDILQTATNLEDELKSSHDEILGAGELLEKVSKVRGCITNLERKYDHEDGDFTNYYVQNSLNNVHEYVEGQMKSGLQGWLASRHDWDWVGPDLRATLQGLEKVLKFLNDMTKGPSHATKEKQLYDHTSNNVLSGLYGINDWMIDFKEIEVEDKRLYNFQDFSIFEGTWNSRPVLLKEFRKHSELSFKKFIFRREVQIWTMLQHNPCILKLYGVCQNQGGTVYLVIEFCKVSLFQVLKDNPNMSWKQKVSLALQIAVSLNCLHNRRPPILHRNLSSVCILMANEKDIRLCDFGRSKALSDDIHSMTLGSGAALKDVYLAPEHMVGGSDAPERTKKSDVYSFGVLLWEIVTGKRPFDGLLIEAFKSHGGYRLPIPPNCPQEISDLISSCWRQDPEERPEINEIRTSLDSFNKLLDDPPGLGPVAIRQSVNQLLELDLGLFSNIRQLDESQFNVTFHCDLAHPFEGKMEVAVKFPKNGAHDQAQETKSLLRIEPHPSIVKFVGMCLLFQPPEGIPGLSVQPLPSLVVEFCEGGSLQNHLHKNSLNVNMSPKLAIQMCLAIKHLHDSQFIHRDIALRNFVLDKNHQVVMIDFSSCRSLETTKIIFLDSGLGLKQKRHSLSLHVKRNSEIYKKGVKSKWIVKTINHVNVRVETLEDLIRTDKPLQIEFITERRDSFKARNSNILLPVNWCPPETLQKVKSRKASDIWMLGITLWQFWYNPRHTPFQIPLPCSELFRYLSANKDNVPLDWDTRRQVRTEFQKLIMRCCRYEHKHRPTIHDVIEELENLEHARHIYSRVAPNS